MARFFDYYILGALGFFVGLATIRALVMRNRGFEVAGIDWPQSIGEKAENVLAGVLPVIRIWETIAYSLPINFHLGWPWMGVVLLDAIPFKILGAIMWTAAIVIYSMAHRVIGTSWRLRVGSAVPGRLVMEGPFAWSRNPIYVSFVLMTTGTFLILGQLIFLLIALISVPLLHRRILREERFLAATHGEAYREYCARVPRYWKGHRRSGGKPSVATAR